jgi:hypothetical protein
MRRTTSVVLLLVSIVAAAGHAQAPAAGAYSAAAHTVRETRGVRVVMRDGVRLSVDVYAPETPGRHGAILSVTPYDNAGPRARARWFAQRGYVVVLGDSRGRYDSEGDWDPFGAKHKTDGYDLIEWMARQQWSNGRVGMIGSSYSGWTQWWAASQVPPALKAIAPQVVPADAFRNFPYQEGVLVAAPLDWAAMMAGRTQQTVAVGDYAGWTNTRASDLFRTPYLELNRARGLADSPWFDQWIRQNRSTSPYWSAISYQNAESWSKITVPSLNMTGWFDAAFPGSVINYSGMKAHGATPEARRPSLVIGPWAHGMNTRVVGRDDYGPDAVIDLDGVIARWFDHWLKGLPNDAEQDPAVRVFVMGENAWHAETAWPLSSTRWTKYYLASGGKANSLKGDGLLTTTLPQRDSADRYVYDPAHPTLSPFTGAHTQDGAVDTRLAASGDEVLVYDTPVLETDVEVTGPIEAKLYLATSALDTDWMVRLVDVHPDGRAALLAEGLMRARNRDPNREGRYNAAALSTIEPNRTLEYTVEFWRPTANLFRKGHQIRVEISSSYFPYYLRNLNSGADNVGLVSVSEAKVATQTLRHGPKYPSHILLPVIPVRGRAP